MKHAWLAKNHTDELILMFGGWALGPGILNPCFRASPPQQDILFVDDYRSIDWEIPVECSRYARITLVAFSFGVASAAHWVNRSGFRTDQKIAINGTLTPANSTTGIPPTRITATADGLTPESFSKFCTRSGGSKPENAVNMDHAQDELHSIITRGDAPDIGFDRIWISAADRIIPPKNQHRAWAHASDKVRTIDAPHVPFHVNSDWKAWLS